MHRFLLSIVQPDGGPPPADVLQPILRDVGALTEEMRTAGALVLTAGLAPAAEAKVARPDGGAVLVTDGPFAETKEHLGGFWIVDAPDAATALRWAEKAARATTLPIELRACVGG